MLQREVYIYRGKVSKEIDSWGARWECGGGDFLNSKHDSHYRCNEIRFWFAHGFCTLLHMFKMLKWAKCNYADTKLSN